MKRDKTGRPKDILKTDSDRDIGRDSDRDSDRDWEVERWGGDTQGQVETNN